MMAPRPVTGADFRAFPGEAIAFYRALESSNERAWFEAHKDDYIRHVQQPAVAFVAAMGERLQTIAPGIRYDTRTNGAGSLMRIHRDTRFSRDKTPYKTNLGIIFWEGAGKKTECPGFYFHLEARMAALYCGLYQFTPGALATYRAAVADDARGSELAGIVDSLRGQGYHIAEQGYKRVPAGYDKGHPRADLLRHTGLFAATPDLDPQMVTTEDFMETALAHWGRMAPLHHWLADVMGG
jgi:uncharacterized protein (TIGR02453 family)